MPYDRIGKVVIFLFTVMNKVEVGTLDGHELFEHRGVQDGLLCPLPIP